MMIMPDSNAPLLPLEQKYQLFDGIPAVELLLHCRLHSDVLADTPL